MDTGDTCPVASGTSPVTGADRSREARAPSRLHADPGAADAHGGDPVQTASMSTGIESWLLRYQGSMVTVE
jgi:hypothetical protein